MKDSNRALVDIYHGKPLSRVVPYMVTVVHVPIVRTLCGGAPDPGKLREGGRWARHGTVTCVVRVRRLSCRAAHMRTVDRGHAHVVGERCSRRACTCQSSIYRSVQTTGSQRAMATGRTVDTASICRSSPTTTVSIWRELEPLAGGYVRCC